MTIIDRGRIKFSGLMSNLLASTEEHPTYRLTVGGELRPETEEQLLAVGKAGPVGCTPKVRHEN